MSNLDHVLEILEEFRFWTTTAALVVFSLGGVAAFFLHREYLKSEEADLRRRIAREQGDDRESAYRVAEPSVEDDPLFDAELDAEPILLPPPGRLTSRRRRGRPPQRDLDR